MVKQSLTVLAVCGVMFCGADVLARGSKSTTHAEPADQGVRKEMQELRGAQPHAECRREEPAPLK